MKSQRKEKDESTTNREHVSIISLVDALVTEAHQMRASDVHIDPHEGSVMVRMRIDGVLQEIGSIPKDIQSEVITRIKVLAGMRTDEHQTPQDGRFRLVLANKKGVDVRISITPTYYGENAVLRLLSDHSNILSLNLLGLSEEDIHKLESAMKRPHGMILATGPTGSGKTTTLYTLLKELNTTNVSIITIEDPIEYAIEGINQIQVNARTGLTFANGLRSIVRQDPNVIMVGEVRDTETAHLAVNTALTGHLVLSTLHTNDAATTLPRLLDLGIEPYLIAATVTVVVGQRLARKICDNCKTERLVKKIERDHIETVITKNNLVVPSKLWFGRGCSECNDSGYHGRVGIYEVMPIDDTIRAAMLEKASAGSIKGLAHAQGIKSLMTDGLQKAFLGLTSIEEVLRVIHE